MPIPEFNEEFHKYTLDGRQIPGVTTILGEFVYFGDVPYPFYYNTVTRVSIPAPYMEAASDYGRAVHKCADLCVIHGTENVSFPSEIKVSMDQFALFMAEHKPEIINTEIMLASRSLWYAGRRDIFCRVKREIWLVDIKTGMVPALCGAQLAAYENLEREETRFKGVIKRFALKLPKVEGERYKLIPYTNPEDWTYFRSKLYTKRYEEVCK